MSAKKKETIKQGENFEKTIEVELTDEELLERARRMAETSREKSRLELERAAIAKSYKTKIDLLEEQIVDLERAVISGKEDRKETVYFVYFFDRKEKELVRAASGEAIETSEMTEEEMQLPLDLKKKKKKELVDEIAEKGKGQ